MVTDRTHFERELNSKSNGQGGGKEATDAKQTHQWQWWLGGVASDPVTDRAQPTKVGEGDQQPTPTRQQQRLALAFFCRLHRLSTATAACSITSQLKHEPS
jgi:hypothetical protein